VVLDFRLLGGEQFPGQRWLLPVGSRLECLPPVGAGKSPNDVPPRQGPVGLVG
jgi:hypothetical protein